MKYTFIMWAMGAVFLLVACVNPRSLFWAFQSWRYRNPKAGEPSDAAYTLQRVQATVAALFLFGLGGFLWYQEEASTTDADEVRTAVMKAVHILETESVTATNGDLMEPNHRLEVDAALDQAMKSQSPALGPSPWGLQAESAGRTEDGGEDFTVTNEDQQYPYCIKVVENGYVANDSGHGSGGDSGDASGGLVMHETTLDVSVHKGSCED
ncbi:hypothetical protein [Streptomyces ochraceiscleroticus]|uniref:DUF6199 domain-containing protein n=1 Tax=Streptomyces ochraceiscleroticus TaxID=47761 RepID=A0ABW1MDR6_9ACTN|nr:hypothetical protein [Streptomyces ochraceiscleroticus]